jgi:hypothetical protein
MKTKAEYALLNWNSVKTENEVIWAAYIYWSM